jgi:hypothetical protein
MFVISLGETMAQVRQELGLPCPGVASGHYSVYCCDGSAFSGRRVQGNGIEWYYLNGAHEDSRFCLGSCSAVSAT